jgi:hypothetical protein
MVQPSLDKKSAAAAVLPDRHDVYTTFLHKMTIFFQNPKTRKKKPCLKTTPTPYTLNPRTKNIFWEKAVISWKKVDFTYRHGTEMCKEVLSSTPLL